MGSQISFMTLYEQFYTIGCIYFWAMLSTKWTLVLDNFEHWYKKTNVDKSDSQAFFWMFWP